MWSPLFYNWFIRQHERKCVSFLSRCHWFWRWTRKEKALSRLIGEWLIEDESAMSIRFLLFIYAFYILDLMRPFVDWVFYFPTHSMTFNFRETAARLSPHWWAPRAPRGSVSHSRCHPRWRSLRCCRQNPPSNRNHHSRQPEININNAFLFLKKNNAWHFFRRCSIRDRC